MSKVQKLIEDAIRAENRRQGTFGLQVQTPMAGIKYGFLKGNPTQMRGDLRLCARGVSRAVLLCGGCFNGRIPTRDGSGKKVGTLKDWPEHVDCGGSGLRVNRRYGRCGKGRLR